MPKKYKYGSRSIREWKEIAKKADKVFDPNVPGYLRDRLIRKRRKRKAAVNADAKRREAQNYEAKRREAKRRAAQHLEEKKREAGAAILDYIKARDERAERIRKQKERNDAQREAKMNRNDNQGELKEGDFEYGGRVYRRRQQRGKSPQRKYQQRGKSPQPPVIQLPIPNMNNNYFNNINSNNESMPEGMVGPWKECINKKSYLSTDSWVNEYVTALQEREYGESAPFELMKLVDSKTGKVYCILKHEMESYINKGTRATGVSRDRKKIKQLFKICIGHNVFVDLDKNSQFFAYMKKPSEQVQYRFIKTTLWKMHPSNELLVNSFPITTRTISPVSESVFKKLMK